MVSALRTGTGKVKAAASKIFSFIKKHKKLSVLVALVLVIVIVVSQFFGKVASAQQLGFSVPQTTVLQRMPLQQVVTATGTTQSSESSTVTSTLTYEIEEVLVSVGDRVHAGQQLLVLDTTDIETNIRQLQQDIRDAKASDELQLSQAQRKLQDAQNQYSLDEERLNREVQNAQDTLNNAEANLTAKQAALEAAWQDMEYQWAVQEETGIMADTTAYEITEQEYLAAQQEYETARQAYQQAVTTRDTTLRTDSLSIENAQDSINSLNQSSSAKTYERQLETYQRQLEQAVVTAPISGVVTQVNATVGSTPTGTSLFVIEDIDNLVVEASVAEYDVVSLSKGLQVEITSDAVDNATWNGTVTDISITSTDSSGNFTVTVAITSGLGQLASGMSAKLNIVVASAENVFAVPYDAVITNEQGLQVVYASGQSFENSAAPAEGVDAASPLAGSREIVVETGLESDYYVEIISGELEEGMAILTDPLGTNVSSGGGMGGMGMMGGGMMGGM